MRVVRYDDEKNLEKFLKEPIDIGQFFFDFVLYSLFIGILYLCIGFVQNVFAYELLYSDSYATDTSSTYTVGTDNDEGWVQYLSCPAIGAGSISSLGITVISAGNSGTYSLMIDTPTGHSATSTNAISFSSGTTYNNTYDFDPPVYCNGEQIAIRPVSVSGSSVNARWASYDFTSSLNKTVDTIKGSYVIHESFGTADNNSPVITNYPGADLKWIIRGEVATATPVTDPVATTTYNFNFSTSTLTTSTESTTIFVPLALLALFLFTVRFVANIVRGNM